MGYYPIEQAVIVPSTTGIKKQKKISNSIFNKRVNAVRKFLAHKYGGFTDIQQTGGFQLKNGKLVRERVVKVVSFATKKDYLKHKMNLMKQLKKWRSQWKQESVGYEKEGDFYTIEKNKIKLKRKIKRKSMLKGGRKNDRI